MGVVSGPFGRTANAVALWETARLARASSVWERIVWRMLDVGCMVGVVLTDCPVEGRGAWKSGKAAGDGRPKRNAKRLELLNARKKPFGEGT